MDTETQQSKTQTNRARDNQGSALVWVMSIAAITTIVSMALLDYADQQMKMAKTSQSQDSFNQLVHQFKTYIFQKDVCNQTFADLQIPLNAPPGQTRFVTQIRNNPTDQGLVYDTGSGILFPLSQFQIRSIRVVSFAEYLFDGQFTNAISATGEGSFGIEVQAIHQSVINPANPLGNLTGANGQTIFGSSQKIFRLRINAFFERDVSPLVTDPITTEDEARSLCTVAETDAGTPIAGFGGLSMRQIAQNFNVIPTNDPSIPLNSTYQEGSFQSASIFGTIPSLTCLIHSTAARISSCSDNTF